MLKDKILIWILIFYILSQLAALFLGVMLFFFAYTILYLTAITYTVIKIAKQAKQIGKLKILPPLALFLLANLILFLIYIPTLIYNPNINWKLKKGGIEVDPMLFQAYVPMVLFIFALLILLLTAVIVKLTLRYKRTDMGF